MEKQTNLIPDIRYLISILITQNGYSFFVLNRTNNNIEVFQEENLQKANAKSIFSKIEAELKLNWKNKFPNAEINICYNHSYFAVVPSEIYNAEFISDYLKFNTKLYTNDSISCEENPTLKLNIPFIPYINIHNELLNFYNTVNFTHSINLSLEWSHKLCKHQNGEHGFIYLEKNSFILVLIKDDKLEFVNYFDFKTPEDLAYYTLFAIEQNNYNRERMHLSMIGEVSEESEIYTYLYHYIKNVVLISFEELNFKTNLNTDQELFFNHNPFLALQLCE